MPRRLLRDEAIVDDEWRYLDEENAATDAPLIIPLARWQADRQAWTAGGGRRGVLLRPADRIESITDDLPRLALVASSFPSAGEGRGYTHARLLRERFGFTGELRASGHVRRDQLFFLARCGFNSFELPDGEIEAARAALSTFSAAYQASNDRGLALTLRRRS